MNKIVTFWNKRGTAARIGIVFLLVCIVNWTRLGLINAGILSAPVAVAPVNQPLTAAPATVGVEPSGRVSLANYERLTTGMSYEQANALLGSSGQEMSSNELGGTRTAMYQWKGDGMANMNAMFQNNKLVSKAQFGLE